jgi:hypothetical protein
MDNKKYIDKVIEHLVRSTKIKHEEEKICFLFLYPHPNCLHLYSDPFFPFRSNSSATVLPPLSFTKYCNNMYGLTEEEIEYVWEQYKIIIRDKVN